MIQARAAQSANAIATDTLFWNKVGIGAVTLTLLATAWAAFAASDAAGAADKAARATDKAADAAIEANRLTAKAAIRANALTRRAMRDSGQAIAIAGRSAQAAVDALDVSRDQLSLAFRPFIMGNGLDAGYGIDVFINEMHHPKGVILIMKLINEGGSPAVNVRVQSNFKVIPIRANAPVFEHVTILDANATFGKSVGFSAPYFAVAGSALTDFLARRSKVVAYCRVLYADFRYPTKDFESEVCVEVVWNGERADPHNGEMQPNVTVIPAKTQNRIT